MHSICKFTCAFDLVGLASAFIVAPAFAQNVTGAGASFPAPLYAKWAGDFNKATGTQVTTNRSARARA